MKLMHADQQMSTRVDLKRSPPPNLVAKLMGLDSLPNEEHDSVVRSDHTRSRSEIPLSYWEEQDNRSFHCIGLDRYRDAYHMSKQPLKFGYNESPIETTDDERMVIVCRKFSEAMSRSTDEKIRHSKLFQDALQVSTSVTPHPRITERITFLNTSKMSSSVSFARSGNNESGKFDQDYVNYTQPARIVVLKPKPYAVSSLYSSQLDSPRMIGEGFIGDVEDVENRELRESVKAITIQMRRRLNRYQKDETLNSSVFKKSETECNPRESEADMSPLSRRHSWDCISRSGITYSQSGVSRASYDAESSVSREAKKRLCERWVLMSSNANSPESRRNCSTLGEILSLSEVKMKVTKAEGKYRVNKNLNPTLRSADEYATSSLRNHKRSKSLPTSFTLFGTKPNADHLVLGSKHRARREDTETKSVRLSLKEKVASFFFSKNKKNCKVKLLRSATKNELQRASADFHRDRNRIIYNKVPRHPSPGLRELSCVGSLATVIGKQDMECLEVVLTPKKPSTSENPDQPSPISVLDTHFEEDELLTSKLIPHCEQFDRHAFQFQHDPICSKLFDKSPPIGSVARTLSRDHSYADTASSYPCKEPLTIQESEGDEILFENVSSSALLDEATSKINAWFCGEIRCFSNDLADDNNHVVETKEVLGKGWSDKLSLEMGNLGKEIEGKLLDELVRIDR